MNEEEFNSFVDRAKFDEHIEFLSSEILAKMANIMTVCQSRSSGGHIRQILTYAQSKLVERMLMDMREAFGDADKFLNTGKMPDYVPPAVQDLLKRMLEDAKRRSGV